jgi:hypothetical protein
MRRAGDLLAARHAKPDGGRGDDLIGGNELRVARFYLFAGENDRALDWLERGYEARDPNLPSISDSPEVDPLRSEPRFQALLRRLNLPK